MGLLYLIEIETEIMLQPSFVCDFAFEGMFITERILKENLMLRIVIYLSLIRIYDSLKFYSTVVRLQNRGWCIPLT